MSSDHDPALRPVALPAAAAILVALLIALGVGIAPNASSRLVDLGERLWPGYAAELRAEPPAPTCDADALAARLTACPATDAAPTPAGADPFDGADPFADPPAADPFDGADPFADPPAADPFAGADPFADPPAADPFAGADPFADPPAADPFAGADPFADAPPQATENCPALRSLHASCVIAHAEYDSALTRLTPVVQGFRSVDRFVGGIAKFPWWRHLLSLVLLAGALATTLSRTHIALRLPRNLAEHRVAQTSQLIAHLFLLASCVADSRVHAMSSAEVENPGLPIGWAIGFGALAAVNLWHLFRPPTLGAHPTGPGRLLMVIPLYAYMVIVAGVYFIGIEQHPSGQAIYLHKFVQHPTVYVGIGLYIWAGMLLSQTSIARRVFQVLRPWHLPPAILAFLVVVGSAVPTAYSGASGIFVIAAGAVIFEQLREAGASKRLALATTAMSGSLGVVLRPCLVVVLIAVMNKQVTTDQLFAEGVKVFALTAALYLIAMVLYNRDGWHVERPAIALPESGRALLALGPHAALGAVVLALYWLLFDTGLNERTAPFVLPVLLLPLVAWDRARPAPDTPAAPGHGFGASLLQATEESSHHVGALLLVMAGSVGLGGVVERSELMLLVPDSLGSLPLTMTVLVVVLVVVGMTMDALGAVVLVTVTVAQIAYANGIDPVHFWMTVLVAFELGYLTPPVALNHLLARQVIGAEAILDDDGVEGFWARNEHLWMPMAVMATALVLVAYVPLAWYA